MRRSALVILLVLTAAPVVAQDPTPVTVTHTKGRPTPAPSLVAPSPSPSPAPTVAPATPVPSAPPGAVDVPILTSRVTDLAGVLPDFDAVKRINDASAALGAGTGSTLLVVFLPTTGPESIEDFTARVQAANPDAVTPYDALLIVATDDRKARIATGARLAETVSDAELDVVWLRDIRPSLATKDWAGAAVHGARGLRAAILDQPLLDIPHLTSALHDETGRIAAAGHDALILSALEELADATGSHLSVVLLPSTLGETPESVVASLEEMNPDVLGPRDALLLVVEDVRDARLIIGADLAGTAVPTIVSRLIWVRDIRPSLVADDWTGAIVGAATGLRAAIERPDLCLLTPAELSAAVGLAFTTAIGSARGCLYAGDPAQGEYALTIGLGQIMEESSLSAVRDLPTTGGRDLTVGGFPAWASDEGVWVDLGEDNEPAADGWDRLYPYQSVMLTAQPMFEFLTDPPDAEDYLPAVADLALERLVDR